MLAACVLATKAHAQCPNNIPHTTGTWRTITAQMPINPISATLLHTGKVFLVSGSENDAYNNSTGAQSYRAAEWDPTVSGQGSIVTKSVTYDIFCSGSAQLPHGRILTIGGSLTYGFTGEKRASFFDPATEEFTQAQSMADGRWYGTATALRDGRILAFSGLNSTGGTNQSAQIYSLATAGTGWGSTIDQSQFTPPLFPRMFALPNGKVFYNGQGAGPSNSTAWIFDPSDSSWTSSANRTVDRPYGSAVLLPLLPPSYTPKVMNFGGGSTTDGKTTEIVDLSAANPSWSAGPAMSAARRQMNAVLLPNGKVLAEGGSATDEIPDTPGRTADVYDPATNLMTSAGTASSSRLYHSTALLLPDATVASMGSNPDNRGRYVSVIEIWTPPYLYDAGDQLITSRPVITGVSSPVLGYGSTFTVNYQSASPIASAVLIRPGSTTHSFDMDQRLIGLCGSSPLPACTGSGTLTLTAPPNNSNPILAPAPPGYYMLFLLDSSGVPSKAAWVELATVTAAPPSGTISQPVDDVTITQGDSVTFDTTSTSSKYSWIFPGGTPSNSTAKSPSPVTFNTPGEYIVSLTLIDASNNSDPSPPKRRVKVLPSSPDFDIFVSPASRTIVPGQSATYTVTVTALNGFGGTVSFSVDEEHGFPTGVTSGGFSPSSVSGSGTSTLTMNTTTSVYPYAASLTIHGTSGNIEHRGSSSLLVTLLPPANLTASTSNSKVTLNWNASVGATTYRVDRSTGGDYLTVGCTSNTTYQDSGLSNGTTYHYAVSAAYVGGPNGGGASSDSVETLATPPCSTPTYSGTLTATKSGGTTGWAWTSGGASAYDLVRGDLMTLVSSAGNFQAAIDALPAGQAGCLANNTTSTSLTDPYGNPAPGSGVFALVRPVTTACTASGSFNDGSPSQIASRDLEIAMSSRDCP